MSGWATLLFLVGLLPAPASETLNSSTERQSVPAALRVQGNASCVTAASLAQILRERLPTAEFSAEPTTPPETAIKVRHELGKAGIEIEISVVQLGQSTIRRVLSAADCQEAILATTFIISVALGADPDADPKAPPEATPAAAPAEATQAAASAPLASPSTQAEAPQGDNGAVAKLSSEAKHQAKARAPTGPMVTVGLGPAAWFGPAPNPLWGVSAQVATVWPGKAGPMLALDATFLAGEPYRSDVGSASFDMGLMGLSACPASFGLGKVRLIPCALGHFGWLHAQGFDTFEPDSAMRAWGDVGAALGAKMALGRRFGLVLGVQALFPLNQDRFQLDSVTFHSVSPVTVGASLLLVVNFPGSK